MDPREKGPKPPHATTSQEYPGTESEMDPRPDYGEESYKGTGKLTGKAAVITGGDSGIGRAVALAFAREGADGPLSYLSEGTGAQEPTPGGAAGRRAPARPGGAEAGRAWGGVGAGPAGGRGQAGREAREGGRSARGRQTRM